ncbi:HdeD family acid-resistance protein [Phaeobacter sp. HF9A]|uniref:HdeD family acid-resistance protein n=1 Tax=Phaeobacter sp. HF9A TaxID=2721561 RepID=UPI001431C205|nr:DUF308 domain-containing protein [Phaeobacter sp. HF9A]NIZ12741.1 hypothetical protein [Phaeobacter sp. HF9A]
MTPDIPDRRALPVAKIGKSLRTVGIIFATLGVLAMLVPAVATLLVEQLVAWLLVLWGGAGLFYARSFKDFSEWRIVAIGFGVIAAVGLGFLFFPSLGAAFMTAILVAVFMLEGVLSVLLGLRMSGQIANWQWIVASGACSFVLGVVVLMQWPETAKWLLGFLAGLNFLSTGVSLILVSRAMQRRSAQ